MAITLHSLRFCGPAASGCRRELRSSQSDTRLLLHRGNPKEGTSLALKKHVEEAARNLNGEAFSRFMDQLYDRISSLLESNDVAQNMGALRAMDEFLIEHNLNSYL